MDLYNQWIEALDTYTPASGKLRVESNQFCCLGVLCDISNIGEWIETDDNRLAYTDETDSIPKATALPVSVQNIVELRTPHGSFELNELSISLRKEILEYMRPENLNRITGSITLVDINDDIYRSNANPFPIIKKILIERPPSLFIYQKAQGEHNYGSL